MSSVVVFILLAGVFVLLGQYEHPGYRGEVIRVTFLEGEKWWVRRDCGTDLVHVRSTGRPVDASQPVLPDGEVLTAYECNDVYDVGQQVVFARPDPDRSSVDITTATRDSRTGPLIGIAVAAPFLVPFFGFLNDLRDQRQSWFRMVRSLRLSWPFARPDTRTARRAWHDRYGHHPHMNAWDLWGLTRFFGDDGHDVRRERDDRRRARRRHAKKRSRDQAGTGRRRRPIP